MLPGHLVRSVSKSNEFRAGAMKNLALIGVLVVYYCQAQVQVPGQVQVRSRSGPRSGPEGPRTKNQRPGPGVIQTTEFP